MEPLVRLDVRITRKELEQLRQLAAARGMSVAALVRVKLRSNGRPIPELMGTPLRQNWQWRTDPYAK